MENKKQDIYLLIVVVLFLSIATLTIVADCYNDYLKEEVKQSIMLDKEYNKKLDINRDGRVSAMDYVILKEKE